MSGERPRDQRFNCQGEAALYLCDANGHTAMTKRLMGSVVDISSTGVSVALAEVITERVHLVYGPMESNHLHLRIVFFLEESELVVPVRTVWFNKKINEEERPFRLGMEFLEPLTSDQLKKIRAS